MESKELIVVKNKKYGYFVLTTVFLFSLVGSITYFSFAKGDSKSSINYRNISGDDAYISKVEEINNDGNIINNEQNILTDIAEDNHSVSIEDKQNEQSISVEINREDGSKEDARSNVPNIKLSYAQNRKLDKNKPMVALTFDDGPNPKGTLEIIKILKQYNSRASFFDIGNLIEKYPEVARAEVESGADVGGHTYSHVNLNSLSKSEIEEEISKMEKVYNDATGLKLKYIRPTYGNANDLVKETLKYPLINWCVDSLDWKTRDSDKILEEIYRTEDFDGKIIIMHVIYDSTVNAVKKLVPDLIKKGYQLVTISEMAEYKGYTLENGKVYYQF